MKAWIVAFSLLLTQAGTAMAQTIAVSSDPRAHYELVGKVRRDDGLVEITTRRQGPSGTSFARREVDCRRRMARQSGCEQRDNQDESLWSRRLDDCRGATRAQEISGTARQSG